MKSSPPEQPWGASWDTPAAGVPRRFGVGILMLLMTLYLAGGVVGGVFLILDALARRQRPQGGAVEVAEPAVRIEVVQEEGPHAEREEYGGG
jgi:hypothetical protein